ncbi:hypothetical protein EON65_54520, partial [archaeon]
MDWCQALYLINAEGMPYSQNRNPAYPPPPHMEPGLPRSRPMSRNPSYSSLDSHNSNLDDASSGPPGELIYMQGSPGVVRPPLRRGPSTSADFTHSGLPPRPMLPPHSLPPPRPPHIYPQPKPGMPPLVHAHSIDPHSHPHS